MRYGSVCSGVEAASLAWQPLGWQPVFFSEVEPFPCAVLKERWGAGKPINMLEPEEASDEKGKKERENWKKQLNKIFEDNVEGKIPNEGDFTKIGDKYAGKIDLLVGGTPCQDLSIAGNRLGFAGERSGLALDFIRLAYESQCKWFVWENVPGALSANGGRDFSSFLSGMVGYRVEVPAKGWGHAGIVKNRRPDRFGVAWRIIDAQYTRIPGFPHAVPQRRKRLFVVGYFGNWEYPTRVLLEPKSLQRHTPPSRKTKQELARDIGESTNTTSYAIAENIIGRQVHTGGNGNGFQKELAYTQNATGVMAVCYEHHPQDSRVKPTEVSPTLGTFGNCLSGKDTIVQETYAVGSDLYNGVVTGNVATTVTAQTGLSAAHSGPSVVECIEDMQHNKYNNGTIQPTVGALCAQDYKQPNAQGISQQKYIIEALPRKVVGVDGYNQSVTGDVTMTLTCKASDFHHVPCVCYDNQSRAREPKDTGNVCCCLQAHIGEGGGNTPLILDYAVRRLTPLECERLMGFPDNYTCIPYKGKSAEQCPDGTRYKACGNSMCVNVMRWIGMRIALAEKSMKK